MPDLAPAILGLLHLPSGVCSWGHFMQSPIFCTRGPSGLPLRCRAKVLLEMLRLVPWQTSCASNPMPWCQAKMVRQALSATRPGVHVASQIACGDGHNLPCDTSGGACAISMNPRCMRAAVLQLQAISIRSAGVHVAFLCVDGYQAPAQVCQAPGPAGLGQLFDSERLITYHWGARHFKIARDSTSLAVDHLSLHVPGTR